MNVTVGQFILESVCMISILNPPTQGQTPPAQPFPVHLEICPLESRGEVLRRQYGGSAVTALGEGGVEERTTEAFDHV